MPEPNKPTTLTIEEVFRRAVEAGIVQQEELPDITAPTPSREEAKRTVTEEEVLRRAGWQPGERAMATAKANVTEVDIQLHITRYRIVKAEKRQTPTDSEWLRWLLDDEAKARKAKVEQQKKDGNHKPWYGVA